MPLVESGEMIVFGALEGQDLGGVGAVRRDGHISLLFVRPDLRRKGIAKALVGEMCRYCTMQFALMRMTVNASVVSTEAYHHMGFRSFPNKRILETIHETPACVKGITIEYYIF